MGLHGCEAAGGGWAQGAGTGEEAVGWRSWRRVGVVGGMMVLERMRGNVRRRIGG